MKIEKCSMDICVGISEAFIKAGFASNALKFEFVICYKS